MFLTVWVCCCCGFAELGAFNRPAGAEMQCRLLCKTKERPFTCNQLRGSRLLLPRRQSITLPSGFCLRTWKSQLSTRQRNVCAIRCSKMMMTIKMRHQKSFFKIIIQPLYFAAYSRLLSFSIDTTRFGSVAELRNKRSFCKRPKGNFCASGKLHALLYIDTLSYVTSTNLSESPILPILKSIACFCFGNAASQVFCTLFCKQTFEPTVFVCVPFK